MLEALAILTLAASDTVVVPLAVVILLAQGVIGMVLWAMKRSLGRVDKLEEEVKAYANEIIETKHAQVIRAIERMERRLEAGDQRFRELHSHDHKAEMQLVQSVELLRRYVTEHCAKASDQKEMGEKVDALRIEVTRLKEAA